MRFYVEFGPEWKTRTPTAETFCRFISSAAPTANKHAVVLKVSVHF